MHIKNHATMKDWKARFPEYFSNCKVLELGSLSVNGSIKWHFDNCEYIGIDKQAGECVDLVVEAKNTKFEPDYFDTIVSFSMFEHDPEWKESIKNNLQWLKPGGRVFIFYGAEGNRPHFHGGFHVIIPHQEFLSYLSEYLGMEILEACFEDDKFDHRFGKPCPGGYIIHARKPL